VCRLLSVDYDHEQQRKALRPQADGDLSEDQHALSGLTFVDFRLED
jgi:hypothetical protein